jgi:hypothetical protein
MQKLFSSLRKNILLLVLIPLIGFNIIGLIRVIDSQDQIKILEKKNQDLNTQLSKVKATCDSLYDVNFVQQIEEGRRERAKEMVFSIYPEVGRIYEEFYTTKTE